jgi:hypothetical protein
MRSASSRSCSATICGLGRLALREQAGLDRTVAVLDRLRAALLDPPRLRPPDGEERHDEHGDDDDCDDDRDGGAHGRDVPGRACEHAGSFRSRRRVPMTPP